MPPRILIAEDDELQSAVLRTALDRRGYSADTVSDGLAAVCRLRTGDYDLALLDYHMPAVDGLTAARLLHDLLNKAQRPRLIGITVAAEELSEKQAGCGGGFFDAVVSKRIGLAALLAVIDTNLALTPMATAPGRQTLAAQPDAAELDEPGGLSHAAPAARGPLETPLRGEGQVHVVSLAAFKTALGSRWERIALRAMMAAEHIIKRRLCNEDVVTRSGDHSFVIWFDAAHDRRNEAVLTRVVRELRLRFLTDFGTEVVADAEPAVAHESLVLPTPFDTSGYEADLTAMTARRN